MENYINLMEERKKRIVMPLSVSTGSLELGPLWMPESMDTQVFFIK